MRRLLDSSASDGVTETPRAGLVRFLRKRHEAIAPEQVGISLHRGRRSPGLRRELRGRAADVRGVR